MNVHRHRLLKDDHKDHAYVADRDTGTGYKSTEMVTGTRYEGTVTRNENTGEIKI